MGRGFVNWARSSLDGLRTSLWLVPLVMFLFGTGLAIIMLRLGGPDVAVGGRTASWLNSGNGADARNLLSTLLTAVISLAGIVFSVTVVSLSLAANAYGPRLIRTFRADRGTQLALGAFAMTIVYLLLVLRAIRGDAPADEVQDWAVAMGSLLALVCVLALVWFLQGVSSLIVADEVVRRVRGEFDKAIDKLPVLGDAGPDVGLELPADFEEQALGLRLPREGYVQSLDLDQILGWAEKHEAIVQLDFRPGDFVVDGDRKAFVYPPPADPDRARREIGRYIVSGQQRTPDQDLEFAIRHLVEVAVRALSPGINDPFTALAVIDRLRGGFARLAGKQLPLPGLVDRNGVLRVVRRVSDFPEIVDAGLDQIRQSASRMPSVLIHMLRAIAAVAEHLRTDEQRISLRNHARLIRAAGGETGDMSEDEDLEREYRRALAALESDRVASVRRPRSRS
ncbi:DUF2254 domain-containing protein [Brevundimonas sp.]|uniref:DUF2254 domain-containing protein n=1 Tax=Brevundimonas sp. TaxID=1871086 RepID=UPI0039190D1F